jgi:hypothetical protein
LLKLIKLAVLPVLTLIINQSLENGIFPDRLKIAKVTPVFKKNEDYLFENYRPISVLPSMSKIFERIIHNQMTSYFTNNRLFYDNQYGFRKKHSTELAALELTNRLIKCMDINKVPLAIFLDLSKAFDTIDHNILINKLKYYGIQGKSLKLIENYLTNRKQYISIGSVNSTKLPIVAGVPQGSILGPLLFTIYINDLHFASEVFHPVVYADDSCLFASLHAYGNAGQDRDILINRELNKISEWMKLNKLSLNSQKTKGMLFHTVHKHVVYPNINIEDSPIEFVDTFDYLGIVFDKNLTWKAHLAKISVKLSKVLGIINKMKNVLSKDVLVTLYNSLFLPHLNYGILCWKVKINQIVKLQKKAVRIITGMKYNAHTDPLFKKMKLLKVQDICTLQEYKFCFKLEHSLLPIYFLTNIFVRNSQIHTHRTRTANVYHKPRIKHEFAKYSIEYIIPSTYNDSPPQIRDKIYTHSFAGFTRYVKGFMIGNYNENCHIQNCYICQS